MSEFHIIFALVSSIVLILSSTGQGATDSNVPITFRVYQHEFQSRLNATVYEVAWAAITGSSPTSFGSLRVGDMSITSGPDMSTGKVGRIEGIAAYTGLTEVSGVLHLVFLFTEGKYKGSSISLLGRKTAVSTSDEAPIVGGTGEFGMARGYTLSSTYSYDPALDYVIYVYDFFVYPQLENYPCFS